MKPPAFDDVLVHYLVSELGQQGLDDIAWAENIEPPKTPAEFAREIIFVICNSGMKNTVARKIFERVCEAIRDRKSVSSVFGNKTKCMAINTVWVNRERLFGEWRALDDDARRLTWLEALPSIGPVTKYHLAKNFGMQCAKPDVHLVRLCHVLGETPQGLCERLAEQTGMKVATIDTLLWRACANGVLDSHTGLLR